MTKKEFSQKISKITVSCLIAGMFSLSGCIIFGYGIISVLNKHSIESHPGAIVVGMIVLIVCGYYAISADKEIKKLKDELYPEE